MPRTKLIIKLAIFCALFFVQVSCSPIFEDEEDCSCQPGQIFDVTLHFHINFTDSIFFQSRSASSIHQRCTVYAFKRTGDSRSYSRRGDQPDRKFQYDFDDTNLQDRKIDLTLSLGTWDLVVWVDYVDSDTGYEYYDCSDFSDIIINESGGHRGNDIYRDAMRGTATLLLNEETVQHDIYLVIDVKRPLAKYVFITTDLSEFVERQGGDQNIDLSHYTVRFFYTGFMPSEYNLLDDEPCDALSGVWYDGFINKISDTEAEIGFDYVLVGDTQTSVPVAVAVYDSSGVQVAASQSFDVPIARNHVTEVRGKFLSSTSSYDPTVNPIYDGSHDYFVP